MNESKEYLYIKAPGKINFHLEVVSPRTDGYHNLVSLFQMVSIHDTLIIRETEENGKTVVNGDFSFPAEENIIYKGVELFRDVYNYTNGVEVECIKRIPQGAGLGGGSSDGAGVLKGLQYLYNRKHGYMKKSCVEYHRLQQIAQKLGSDVPFFLGTPAAVITGRGEHLYPVEPRTDGRILLITPSFSVSTKEAFSWIKPFLPGEPKPPCLTRESLINYYQRSKYGMWPFFNSFQPLLIERFPIYLELFNFFKKSGALFQGITGSGSTCYGIYSSNNVNMAIPDEIKRQTSAIHWVKMLAEPPLPVYNTC